ncbi:zinc finger and BTB domain-containing protein 41-like [Leptopilina heterotoma]|uniref:zinc finger and BTB domain-containing protein 41-like n=1 Tax=Leptopilina heterotoma TaxID=63436 RepID=UPI001CA8BA7D|nr:zinc finger and BTB domain-containing protein 41-like [Leptopilina heterotoma]
MSFSGTKNSASNYKSENSRKKRKNNQLDENLPKMEEQEFKFVATSVLELDHEEEVITGDPDFSDLENPLKLEDDPESVQVVTIEEDDDNSLSDKLEPIQFRLKEFVNQNNCTNSVTFFNSKKQFSKCPACNALFISKQRMRSHILTHAHRGSDKRVICNYCNFTTDDVDLFNSHLKCHENQCEVCNQYFFKKKIFESHLEVVKSTYTIRYKRDHFKNYVCNSCNLSFDFVHQLQKHWFKHTCTEKKTYQCDSCSALFDTVQNLENHVCLQCPICLKTYSSFPTLRAHTRFAKHFLYCKICKYEFSLRVDHVRHLELHKKKFKPYEKLMLCLKTEDESTLKCEVCGKLLQTDASFVSHVYDEHKLNVTNYKRYNKFTHCLQADDGSTFQCEVCGKLVSTELNFVNHVYKEHKINVTRDDGENSNSEDQSRSSVKVMDDITFEEIKIEEDNEEEEDNDNYEDYEQLEEEEEEEEEEEIEEEEEEDEED